MSTLPEVFRDAWIVVVDKPSGLASQPDPSTHDSVFTRVRAHHPEAALHHRLDRPASGLMVLALHPEANAGLAAGFREHAIQRDYLAILAGDRLEPGQTTRWDAPLDGRDARSDVEVLGAGGGLLAVRLSPHTGRTHQLRRHAALAGLPIVGDRRHGGRVATWLPRLALHAARLRLRHPVTGEKLDLRSPLPSALQGPWKLAGGPEAPWGGVEGREG